MLGAHRQLTGYYLRHAKVGAMTATSIVYYWKRVRTPSSKTRPLLQVWEQFPPIISTRVQPRPKGCAHTVDIWQLKSQPRPKGRNLDEKHLRLAPQGARCLSYVIANNINSSINVNINMKHLRLTFKLFRRSRFVFCVPNI